MSAVLVFSQSSQDQASRQRSVPRGTLAAGDQALRISGENAEVFPPEHASFSTGAVLVTPATANT